jgi:hypothetical protein
VLDPFEMKLREVLAFLKRLHNKVAVFVGSRTSNKSSAAFLATVWQEN